MRSFASLESYESHAVKSIGYFALTALGFCWLLATAVTLATGDRPFSLFDGVMIASCAGMFAYGLYGGVVHALLSVLGDTPSTP